MLVLSRHEGQHLYIDDIIVKVLEVRGKSVRIAIEAPPTVTILRAELRDQLTVSVCEDAQHAGPVFDEANL
jgi:carbon storage regulator CsrA